MGEGGQCGEYGCQAVVFQPFECCLPHLDPETRARALRHIGPGSNVDLTGAELAADHLAEILDAVRDDDDIPTFGYALFPRAVFSEGASFDHVAFRNVADFTGATFRGAAWFEESTFEDLVVMSHAVVEGRLMLDRARFDSRLLLGHLQLGHGATFDKVRFARTQALGPIYSDGPLDFDEATSAESVTIDARTPEVLFVGTRVGGSAVLRLQGASVWLDAAILGDTTTIVSSDIPELTSQDAGPKELIGTTAIGSLRGVDAGKLVLSGVDLSRCRFSGSYNLDQIRIEGRCRFADVPRGVRFRKAWPPVWWWTKRQTIIEEHRWRHRDGRVPDGWTPSYPERPQSWAGWRQPTHPERLSAIYRQLRKALEDAKNEPGAADFYYGETDMRRLSPTTPRAERFVLTLYWLFSGYGLRAGRALLGLVALVGVTTWLLVNHGLAAPDANTEQALRSALDAVVFRSDDAELTTAGTYIEMVARIGGPILLALAALSVRNRVKR